MKIKNEHLLPATVVDIVERLSQPNIRENEKMNYILRLETIRDYCDAAIKNNEQFGKKKVFG